MDSDLKLFLGKLLGEVYRIQQHLGLAVPVRESTVYGLLRGFEHVIDHEVLGLEGVSREQFEEATKIFEEHWRDPEKLAEFRGFYDIERKLEAVGVDRGTAIAILKYFKADHGFGELIEKMNSSNSPIECKTFELSDFEK